MWCSYLLFQEIVCHKILSYLLLAIHAEVVYQSPGLFMYKIFGIFKGHGSSLSLGGLNNELMLPSAVILESEPLSTALTALVTMLRLLQWWKDIRKAFFKLNCFAWKKNPNIDEVWEWGTNCYSGLKQKQDTFFFQARRKADMLKTPLFLPTCMTKINSRYQHSLQTFSTWLTERKHRSCIG